MHTGVGRADNESAQRCDLCEVIICEHVLMKKTSLQETNTTFSVDSNHTSGSLDKLHMGTDVTNTGCKCLSYPILWCLLLASFLELEVLLHVHVLTNQCVFNL